MESKYNNYDKNLHSMNGNPNQSLYQQNEDDFDLNPDHVIVNPFKNEEVREDLREQALRNPFDAKEYDGKNKILKKDDEVFDGHFLDKYDNFYKTTKSLLVLFQIMGVMPIMRSAPGLTTFKWSSPATIWSYCLFTAETFYVMLVFKARLEITLQRGKRFDEYIYNVIILSILVPHFLLPIAAWRNGSEVAKFKNMWTHFQVRFLRLTGEPLTFKRLSIITWSCCFISWGLGAAVMLSEYFLQPDLLFWHTIAYYHILATLNGLFSLWYVNCTAMGTACKHMTRCMQKAIMNRSDTAYQLAEYRHLWVDLSTLMQQLGKAYSNMYGMYCIVILFTTIIAAYGCLAEIIDHGLSDKEAGLVIIAFYCMGLLFVICNEAYHASRKVRFKFQDRLFSINLISVDKETRTEIVMFLNAIHRNPPIMNLNGYVNIDRQLMTSTVATLTTFLIVLMQFKLTLLRNQSNKQEALTMDETTVNITISHLIPK